MKFSCEKALLQSMVSIASRTVAVKSPIPALEGVLLEAGNTLRITGYNMKTGIRGTVPARIVEQGSIALSARLFGDIIRRLPDDMVTLTTDKLKVNIVCGMTEFNIMGIDPEEYPELPTVEYQNTIVIPQRKLQMMINQTLFAVSTSENRPIHTGTLFELDADGVLTMVSVDGYRLALRREKTEKPPQRDPFSFVVPAAALSEVSKICSDSDEMVEIIQGMKQIMFKIGDIMLISRRLEGEFLNYRRAIPMNNPVSVKVDRRRLMASIDRCSLMISEQQKSPLRCTFGNEVMELHTNTALGTAHDVCPTVGDGNGLEIGFNHKYLMDALKAAPADFLRIELSRAVSPCILLPETDEAEHDFVYMVLPVRLKAD